MQPYPYRYFHSPSTSQMDVSSNVRMRVRECNYCRNMQGVQFRGHDQFNCPTLSTLDPCRICGAYGANNHTITHCPGRPRDELSRNEQVMSQIRRNLGPMLMWPPPITPPPIPSIQQTSATRPVPIPIAADRSQMTPSSSSMIRDHQLQHTRFAAFLQQDPMKASPTEYAVKCVIATTSSSPTSTHHQQHYQQNVTSSSTARRRLDFGSTSTTNTARASSTSSGGGGGIWDLEDFPSASNAWKK